MVKLFLAFFILNALLSCVLSDANQGCPPCRPPTSLLDDPEVAKNLSNTIVNDAQTAPDTYHHYDRQAIENRLNDGIDPQRISLQEAITGVVSHEERCFEKPIYLRARIDSSVIKALRGLRPRRRLTIPRDSKFEMMMKYLGYQRFSNTERGHILADSLGGPNLFFNFIPQSRDLNRGTGSDWYGLERTIREWIYGSEWEENDSIEYYAVIDYIEDSNGKYKIKSVSIGAYWYRGSELIKKVAKDYLWILK